MTYRPCWDSCAVDNFVSDVVGFDVAVAPAWDLCPDAGEACVIHSDGVSVESVLVWMS